MKENTPKSQFNPTVCLTDWWLVKTENELHGRRQLAVAGFTSREKQAMRVFSSAPILKRYDMFTVETTDAICVILQGFINRDRTVENGFPSDVFNHFLFGFPPYWKEYVEKFMGEESNSKDVSGFNPQSGTMEGEQPHVDNHEKDLGSQDKVDVERPKQRKKTHSSAVPPTKKSDNVISGSRENLRMSSTPSACLAKESNSGGPTVEDNSTLDMPVNCEKNKMKPLNIDNPSVTDKAVDDSSKVRDLGGTLSACRLTRSKKSIDNPRKVELDKRKSMKVNSERDMSSSDDILSQSEGRVSTRLMSSLKTKQKNNKTSVRISMEGEQPHVDKHEKDLVSQDKMDVKRPKKRKKTHSSAVSPTKKSDNVISGSHENLRMSSTPAECLEKESYSGSPTVEDHSTLDMPVNCETNKMKPLNISNPSATDKAVDNSSKVRDFGGVLSACRLTRSKKSIDNPMKVELDKRKSMKANPEREMSLSEDILSHSEGRVSTRLMSSLRTKQKNNKTSIGISVGEKISNCVSSMGPKIVVFTDVDCEPGGTSIYDFEVSEAHVPTDKIKVSNLDGGGSVIDKSEQISQTPNKNKDLRKVKTAGKKKAKQKEIGSLSTVADANNQKDSVIPNVNGLSEKTKASVKKTRRKLSYETPTKEKTKVPVASPESTTSFKRSRSGRLLMPTLDFWRNQRAVYNVDGTITGIEGMQP